MHGQKNIKLWKTYARGHLCATGRPRSEITSSVTALLFGWRLTCVSIELCYDVKNHNLGNPTNCLTVDSEDSVTKTKVKRDLRFSSLQKNLSTIRSKWSHNWKTMPSISTFYVHTCPVLRRVRRIEKSEYCQSCLSHWTNGPHWTVTKFEIWGYFKKICPENTNFIKMRQEKREHYVKT